MRRSRFTETQIVSILKEADAGASAKDICRRHGISPATWYQWKSKYGGMGASELKRTKELEAELGQMKRMYGMHPVGTTVVPTPDGAHPSNVRTPVERQDTAETVPIGCIRLHHSQAGYFLHLGDRSATLRRFLSRLAVLLLNAQQTEQNNFYAVTNRRDSR